MYGNKSISFLEGEIPKAATWASGREPWDPVPISANVQDYSSLNTSHCPWSQLFLSSCFSNCEVSRICSRSPLLPVPPAFPLKSHLRALPFLSEPAQLPAL